MDSHCFSGFGDIDVGYCAMWWGLHAIHLAKVYIHFFPEVQLHGATGRHPMRLKRSTMLAL